MSWLTKLFDISPQAQREIERTAGDLSEALKKFDFGQAIRSASPWWVGAVAAAAGESIPLVKFLVKLAEKLPDKPSAKELGLLACTLAFQRAAEDALLELGPPQNRIPLVDASAEAKSRVSKLKVDDPDIRGSRSSNLQHILSFRKQSKQ
jgi:hypothetical protein